MSFDERLSSLLEVRVLHPLLRKGFEDQELVVPLHCDPVRGSPVNIRPLLDGGNQGVEERESGDLYGSLPRSLVDDIRDPALQVTATTINANRCA